VEERCIRDRAPALERTPLMKRIILPYDNLRNQWKKGIQRNIKLCASCLQTEVRHWRDRDWIQGACERRRHKIIHFHSRTAVP